MRRAEVPRRDEGYWRCYDSELNVDAQLLIITAPDLLKAATYIHVGRLREV
jgi:hypothetical protein